MANIRVSGSRTITPSQGPNTIVSPTVIFDSSSTSATGIFKVDSTNNVDNPLNYQYNPADIYGTKAERLAGAAYVAGGLGIEKDLNVGGFIYGRISQATTSSQLYVTNTNVDSVFYPVFTDTLGKPGSYLYGDNDGLDSVNPGLTYNPYEGKLTLDRAHVVSTDTSYSSTSGAVVVDGGVGIGGDLYVGDVHPNNSTKVIGSTSTRWAEAYVQTVYTNILASTEKDIQVKPASGLTDIFGDIRVRGQNPIGTAPVVTNVLYVTMDGNDTNDGRAMDASRACRTIGAALNSPFYESGTQIIVSPGHYLEDNPLVMKPYTSIRGSDLRTTFIEPINKTQDLFHVNSGCYLTGMNFLNGRSGLLDGPYARGFNRGAYATAFPPQTGDDRIDLFHSPYIQNCTNQSGPWLKDGTMFVPSQTVQIPRAVASGTWIANTATIELNTYTGTIKLGDTINAGQQNKGFFNARTLMLANKPFLQEQVVAYVDQTFVSGSFANTYNTATCRRDLGLIVDSISLDLVYDSNSESEFAGLQYWNQTTSAIAGEQTTTTNAINFLKGKALTVIANAGGATFLTTATGLFTKLTDIITNGTVGVTDQIVSNGLPISNLNPVYDALIANIPTFKTQVIDWITQNNPTFVYNTETCARDVGYIIQSIAFDLKHGGNKQTIKAGVYYYNYSTTDTQVPNQLPQTAAAYNYLRSIIPYIVKGIALPTTYQNTTPQDLSQPLATNYEAKALQQKIDIITNIILQGPASAPNKTPINLIINPLGTVRNAFNILLANKSFIQAEIIAYIDATVNTFNYSREYCFRDVGILVENISYDATFGGNEKSVESGLAYYDGVISKIAGQEQQTTAAISYLNTLIQNVITNTTCTNLLVSPKYSQVRNTVLTGGEITKDSITHLVNIINDIIINGPSVAPAVYKSTGPDAAFVSAEILMQANRQFIQENTINWINNTYQAFPYNKIKCRRDAGIIVDSIAFDLLYPTASYSQTTFAGLQYWGQDSYVDGILREKQPTIDAITYLKELSVKIIKNITPDVDLVNRFSPNSQTTATNYGTNAEVANIKKNFDIIIDIIGGNKLGWTDKIIANGPLTNLESVKNSSQLLQDNKSYLADEVIAYIESPDGLDFTSYTTSTCRRDVGFIIDSISFDLLHGGNRQSIQSGLSYYGFNGTTSVIRNETTATIAAFNFMATVANNVIRNIPVTPKQTRAKQNRSLPASDNSAIPLILNAVSTVTSIISGGPTVGSPTPISLRATTSTAIINAANILIANRDFIKEEVVAWIDRTYNSTSFNYNEELCYRDTGLIIDAVSQDILLGGNEKSVEAGLAYWNFGYNQVTGQETTTTAAINYARDLALEIIANKAVTTATTVKLQPQTITKQIINPFFRYGGDYMPQQAVARNFGIVTDIIQKGTRFAPPVYIGGGLFASTGLNGSAVLFPPTVTSITTSTLGNLVIGLSTSTVGFGNNATLYFGDTAIYPLQDADVNELCLQLSLPTSTWDSRKIDPIGSMGGSLVDGAVISDRSPIQSFVYDAFTQVNQGGRGVYITNDGYAQLVSVFTIFCSIGVQTDNGGIASIVNSNANFGDICLLSKGYGSRKFSGTVYNPPYKSYPDTPGPTGFSQYYPQGFWPNNGKIEVFLPDVNDRPHISLVMEIVPPDGHINEQQLPGFLNAVPTLSTLTTGSLVISNIDTDGIAVGNSVYIKDQNNNRTYADADTVVTDIGYKTITLSKPLIGGGSDPSNSATSTNNNWFTFYFCGNSYYSVISSVVANNPKPDGVNILSAAGLEYQDPKTGVTINPPDQVGAHVETITFLQNTINDVISNRLILGPLQTVSTQKQLLASGASAIEFIGKRFDDMIAIINAPTITDANNIVPQSLIKKTGSVTPGAGAALALINENINFLVDETAAYADTKAPVGYNSTKCKRDVKIILQRLIYDIESGGNYNSVMTGLSYWSRNGTHHLVELGENVRRTDLFPDGATLNFYQRSYISASGYVFEYVGAGTNYGALPQRGVADPVQGKETVQLNGGKVFFTSTDQNGDFRIGPGLVISQATGVLSGRTFTKSLFANMTPFILAIEG